MSEEVKLNLKVYNKHVFGKYCRFSSDLSVLDQRAIAASCFSKLDCFHAQIFYPQISYLQILNPQIWAISTSRFSKIECFLMDLQTFEEEIFKHSKLFLSIFLRCKRYEQWSTQRSKKGFSYSTRAKEEYAFTKGGLIPNTTKIRVNMPRIPIPTKSLFS